MKKIFYLFAILAVTAAVAMTGCHNRPPFALLQESVDSVNTYLGQQVPEGGISVSLYYDEVTNTVVFKYKLPNEQMAEFTKDNIAFTEDVVLNEVLPNVPAELMKNIVDAKAAVMLEYTWPPKGRSEFRIEADKIAEAYKEFAGGK